MTEQEKIIAKIRESANETAKKKLEEEKQKAERRINLELKDIERCLQYIQNKLVFKVIGDAFWTKGYILADENVFFEDYNKECKYAWEKGIKFSDPSSKPYEPLYKVNGECYYDMRFIIRHYEERFKKYSDKLYSLQEKFEELEKMAKELKNQELHIKKLIEQYKQVEIDESWLEKLRGEENE